MVNKTITAPRGFRTAAVAAGIKQSGKADLGLIVADKPCAAAAVFTKNKIVGHAVMISRKNIKNGKAQAIFVNAGNANTCTGPQGLKDAENICKQLANELNLNEKNVLICSTGIIGRTMPMKKVQKAIDIAADRLDRSIKNGNDIAEAILTTDTIKKTAYKQIRLGSKDVKIAGIAKGSGMIAPNMATMLAFITTDANIKANLLKRAISDAVDGTFNKVTVDNHTSTSDTAIIMASGRAENKCIDGTAQAAMRTADYKKFTNALYLVCDELARQIAADGEGASQMVSIKIRSCLSKKDAHKALRAIADSPLVKCAFHGADPNWGRIISAVGYSGAKFDPKKIGCKIAGVTVFKNATPTKFDPKTLSKKMKNKQLLVEVDLAAGKFNDFCYTCDLSGEYVKINADYHT